MQIMKLEIETTEGCLLTPKIFEGATRADNSILSYTGKYKNKEASSEVEVLMNKKFDHHIENIEYFNFKDTLSFP